jgi:hypothetical protein
VDVSPQDRKVKNLLEGKKPPQLQLGEEEPRVSRWDAAPKFYATGARLSFAWDGEALGGDIEAFEVTFSPLPYFAFGIELFDIKLMFDGRDIWSDGEMLTALPIHAGLLVPVREGITAVCYGKMHWLGVNSEDYEPLLHTGFRTSSTDEPGYFGVVIAPGIKAGLLFRLDDVLGLELSYTGTWFTQRYVSSIGLGLVGFNL